MQLLGFDVDPLNSVQLCNHTAYHTFGGQVLSGDDMARVMGGLRDNALLAYSHVLTGYVSSASFLRGIAAAVRDIRAVNPGVVFVCDPVLGDHGKLYVPADLVPIYRDEVAPLANILTPNQFECEQLSGVAITDLASGFAACDVLHSRGTRAVVVTSSALPAGQDGHMLLLASVPWGTLRAAPIVCPLVMRITCERLPHPPTHPFPRRRGGGGVGHHVCRRGPRRP